MRISTSQFYQTSSLSITAKQTQLNEQMPQLSSGKRIITAKDDAVATPTLLALKQELSSLERFERNINQATNRNQQQEGQLANVESLMLSVQEIMIQANNGSLSDVDRDALAQQLVAIKDQMLDTANSQDESGNYQFSGFQVDQVPFIARADNTVSYQGDLGERKLQVASNVLIPVNQSGQDVFIDGPNNVGDFSANYATNAGGMRVEKAVIADRGLYDDVGIPPDYTFDFTDSTADGLADTLTVTDSGGVVQAVLAPYAPGDLVSFNGVEVTITGTPEPGDQLSITPDDKVGVFEVIQNAIDWVSAKGANLDPVQHQVEYQHQIEQIKETFSYVNTRRSELGIRLQTLEQQENTQGSYRIILETARSSLEDLDYAEAVAEFEQAKVALQVSQQTFSQVSGLNLFNYI